MTQTAIPVGYRSRLPLGEVGRMGRRGEGGGLAVSWMPACTRTMVGAVAHECSLACSL